MQHENPQMITHKPGQPHPRVFCPSKFPTNISTFSSFNVNAMNQRHWVQLASRARCCCGERFNYFLINLLVFFSFFFISLVFLSPTHANATIRAETQNKKLTTLSRGDPAEQQGDLAVQRRPPDAVRQLQRFAGPGATVLLVRNGQRRYQSVPGDSIVEVRGLISFTLFIFG